MKDTVKNLLKEKGMTAKDLALKMGISESALSLSLNGNPTLSRLQEIATALEVEVSELFAPSKGAKIVCPLCGGTITLNAEAETK